MKKLIIPFLFSLILVFTSFAKGQSNSYKKIDYIHVDKEHLERFIKLAETELSANYESLISSGDLLNWRLYKVQYPGGDKNNYNFVSVATAPKMETYSSQFSAIASSGFIPNEMEENTKKHFTSLCSSVKSELWKVENRLPNPDTSSVEPSRYMTMDYMNVTPGKSSEYLMLEDEIAKPIHAERVNIDRMHHWEVYALLLPGGINYGYNYATGNYFDNLSHIEFGFTNELINETMGANQNVAELFDTIYRTRDLVKIELWEIVAHAE